mmetsp:Transcript_96043/g.277346  ORF Transcript_96043/g.277346 Transcript_96043/m.277346 type:complete len:232 (+) Transcript_96043:1431-2126(+)
MFAAEWLQLADTICINSASKDAVANAAASFALITFTAMCSVAPSSVAFQTMPKAPRPMISRSSKVRFPISTRSPLLSPPAARALRSASSLLVSCSCPRCGGTTTNDTARGGGDAEVEPRKLALATCATVGGACSDRPAARAAEARMGCFGAEMSRSTAVGRWQKLPGLRTGDGEPEIARERAVGDANNQALVCGEAGAWIFTNVFGSGEAVLEGVITARLALGVCICAAGA